MNRCYKASTAMRAYRGQRWQRRQENSGSLTSYPDDGPTQIFLQRARILGEGTIPIDGFT
jgi:hypothetical protein